MSVIAHLRIPADTFELGRLMRLKRGITIDLETMVPLGENAVPLFTIHAEEEEEEEEAYSLEERVRNHPSVRNLRKVSVHDGDVVFALDWNVERDVIIQGMMESDAHLLSARGTADTWEFELRFPTHEALSQFQEYCLNANIQLDVGRIYNPTRPGSGRWFGLTSAQKDTLLRAVEGGYYSIPRGMSTQDLAEEFGISDQAVTERLRRAIVTLVDSTIIPTQEQQDEFEAVAE